MDIDSGDSQPFTEEEADVLRRSRRRSEGGGEGIGKTEEGGDRRFATYKDSVVGDKPNLFTRFGGAENEGGSKRLTMRHGSV